MESCIAAKGQVTIPKVMREYLGVGPGDRVRFFRHPDGHVVMLPKVPITALAGFLQYKGEPVSLEEMEEGVAAGALGESTDAAER